MVIVVPNATDGRSTFVFEAKSHFNVCIFTRMAGGKTCATKNIFFETEMLVSSEAENCLHGRTHVQSAPILYTIAGPFAGR